MKDINAKNATSVWLHLIALHYIHSLFTGQLLSNMYHNSVHTSLANQLMINNTDVFTCIFARTNCLKNYFITENSERYVREKT